MNLDDWFGINLRLKAPWLWRWNGEERETERVIEKKGRKSEEREGNLTFYTTWTFDHV